MSIRRERGEVKLQDTRFFTSPFMKGSVTRQASEGKRLHVKVESRCSYSPSFYRTPSRARRAINRCYSTTPRKFAVFFPSKIATESPLQVN